MAPPADVPARAGRALDALRKVSLERGAAPNAEGSCLIAFGSTRVLCTASVEDGVPGWKRGKGEGWLTAEYAMLPRATHTRTASITGACVAVIDAFAWMMREGKLTTSPVRRRVAAVSVGTLGPELRLDLEYAEDVRADVDMNVVMTSERRFVEVQGTGEHGTFDRGVLDGLLALSERGIAQLLDAQAAALGLPR